MEDYTNDSSSEVSDCSEVSDFSNDENHDLEPHSIHGHRCFAPLIIIVMYNIDKDELAASEVRRYLHKGVNVEAKDKCGLTALDHAVYKGFTNCIFTLLDFNCEANMGPSLISGGDPSTVHELEYAGILRYTFWSRYFYDSTLEENFDQSSVRTYLNIAFLLRRMCVTNSFDFLIESILHVLHGSLRNCQEECSSDGLIPFLDEHLHPLFDHPNPSSLQCLTRKSIRKSLGKGYILDNIKKLLLPHSLKSFLAYEVEKELVLQSNKV